MNSNILFSTPMDFDVIPKNNLRFVIRCLACIDINAIQFIEEGSHIYIKVRDVI